MDLNDLFTSFDGRINRMKFCLGALVLLTGWFVLDWGLASSTIGSILVILVTLGLFYPAYAVTAKRFQDRDRPGKTALYGLIPLFVATLFELMGLTGSPGSTNALGWLTSIIILGVLIWFGVELCLLGGTIGSNRYGPDPLTLR